jgi:hypothetical protein
VRGTVMVSTCTRIGSEAGQRVCTAYLTLAHRTGDAS